MWNLESRGERWVIQYIAAAAAAAAKSLQSCPTLCDPTDGSPPGPHPWDSLGKNTGVGCHFLLQCMKVKSQSEVAQSCPTLSNPMDCSPPGSSVHGMFQARVLEWGAIAFSNFVLGYSQLTMLWQFQMNSKGTQPYIYMYAFSPKLSSHPGCQITLSRVPCAIQ